MSRVADSISMATARMRSLKLPDSSSWTRKSSNCFSSAGAEGSPDAIVAEQRAADRGRAEAATAKWGAVERSGRVRVTAEAVERTELIPLSLGFKERESAP